MKLIDGKEISNTIREELKEEIENEHINPSLAVIQVGDNEASNIYVKNKQKAAIKVGIESSLYKCPNDITEDALKEIIDVLNNDDSINAILVQLPLPSHLDENKIVNFIKPLKDVDGLTSYNKGLLAIGKPLIKPCTPLGVIELLKRSNVKIEGKHAVVVGRSNLVGKPLADLLLLENATVTVTHSKTIDLENYTKKADILIVATGNKELIKKDMVKKDAIVIDVGINKEEGHICGDVCFDDVKNIAEMITPVPGGVGPMTITMLLKNTIKCYKLQNLK